MDVAVPLAAAPAAVTPRAAASPPALRMPLLAVWMTLAIALVASLAYWDERREAAAALSDFAQEQSSTATGLAAALSTRLDPARRDSPPSDVLRDAARSVEEPGWIVVLLREPSGGAFMRTSGTPVESPVLVRAFDARQKWVRLTREEAASLGLPARTATAGLSVVDAGDSSGADWGVAVVATAQRERDRQVRAEWRLGLSVLLASGLVLAFGGIALRKQRKELELARELAIAELEQERDAQLVLADKLATMGALATGIAHEVSTPLGVIVGRAEQLQNKVESDEKARRALSAILEQAERIGRVIRGFLGLARGEAPSLEHVDPISVARASTGLVEHRFAKAGVSLHLEVEPGLAPVACEPRLFEQALVNLLLNACDACEPGGNVTLLVRQDRERVEFDVVDDGAGITAEAASRATQPFFTTKPAGKGTGLGLAIANEIVKHHQGSLAIRPRDDGARGTRATIELPIVHEVRHD
jgi:two-component system NtrC family sensor kinase